jgi:hypothetical protein
MAPESLKERMDAVERLTSIFRLERLVYLVITTLSLAILLTCAVILLVQKGAEYVVLTGLFGSSGLIAYSTGRLLVMWNQALQLIAGKINEGL